MSTVANRIMEVRKRNKLTQKQFGEKLTVSASYISKVESEKEKPTDMLLKLIALEFNVSFDWLYNGEGAYEISKNQPDFYDRAFNKELHQDICEYINEFLKVLDEINNPVIDLHASAIFASIISIIKMNTSTAYSAVIIEVLSNIVSEFFYAIETIESHRNDPSKYKLYMYKTVHNCANELNDIVLSLIKIYEEKFHS